MEERKKTGKSYLWALFAFLLAVAADQFTKWLAVTLESCRIDRLYLQLEHC